MNKEREEEVEATKATIYEFKCISGNQFIMV